MIQLFYLRNSVFLLAFCIFMQFSFSNLSLADDGGFKLESYAPKHKSKVTNKSPNVRPLTLGKDYVPLSKRKTLGAKKAMEFIRRKEEARSLTEDPDQF